MNSNASIAPIERLETILDHADYMVRREPIAAGVNMEQLYVALLNDAQNRIYIMELMFLNDFSVATNEDDTSDDLSLLQFYCAFPFTVSTDAITSVERVLNFVNQSYPMGHFNVIEQTGTICFKYVYATENANDVSEKVVLEIVSLAELALSRLGPLCERVSLMDMTAAEVIQDIADRGLFIEPTEEAEPATS